ncbi:hypothetical protein G6F65_022937 [Rhizopus arrhizus]|nr:hypothetical protein G6F65_022937 [Rhizopus arrhizus]
MCRSVRPACAGTAAPGQLQAAAQRQAGGGPGSERCRRGHRGRGADHAPRTRGIPGSETQQGRRGRLLPADGALDPAGDCRQAVVSAALSRRCRQDLLLPEAPWPRAG